MVCLIECGFTFAKAPGIPHFYFSVLRIPFDSFPFGTPPGCGCWKSLRLIRVSPAAPASSPTRLFLSDQVCELDIIFNFEKAYFILDEFIMGGEIQETSKKSAVKAIEDSDMLQEVSTTGTDNDGDGDDCVLADTS